MKKVFRHINNIIFFILKVVTLYMSILIPKDKTLLIFGSWFGNKYADNARYLYEYILYNRKDLHPVWMTNNNTVYNKLHMQGVPVCKSGTIDGIKKAIRASAVFLCTSSEDIGRWEATFIGYAVSVNLWHGIPLKKIMYDDKYNTLLNHPRFNAIKEKIISIPLKKSFICSSSPAITKIYKSAFRMNEKYIWEVGQPRNDYFLLPHKNSIKQRFLSRKLVVYMPTHRNEGKTPINLDEIFDLRDLDLLLEMNDAFLIIKKHYYHRNDPKLDSSKYSRIVEISQENIDTQELLDAADILITDYSSCYVDYLFLNRPLLFYDYDYEDYLKQDRQLYFDYETTTPGPKCRNYDELKKQLEEVLCGKDNYQSQREKVGKMFYGEQIGTLSSPRVLAAVEAIINKK